MISKAIEICYGQFQTGDARSIPLMPKDAATAKQWQTMVLTQWLQDRYYTPEEVQYFQQVWLQHPAVKDYKFHTLTGNQLLGAIDRSKHPQSYWHASAAECLIPENSRLVPPSITFKEGNYLDASELLRQLTAGEPVKSVIYSDRHYKSAVHARNMQKLAELGGIHHGVIFNEGVSTQSPKGWQIEEVTLTQSQAKARPDHDRYWIFITHKKPLLWKCSTSFDFVDFRKPEPRVKESLTFTRMDKNDLPDYLLKALSSEEQSTKEHLELTQ